jgi:uncharacterized protein YbjT (DUF2867 family)
VLNTLTGKGLAEVLEGAAVVVDVSNSPSFEETAVMNFFTTSTRNLLQYEAAADVRHHVALSVVGTERPSESGYFRAKIAQETLIRESSVPYPIIHATQFFEFVKSIADAATDGTTVRLAPALAQPMAADDVARAVGRIAVGTPVNGTVEVGGPQQFRLDELIRQGLRARNDPRTVVADPHARYFGAELSERTLVPGNDAQFGQIRFEDWLGQPALGIIQGIGAAVEIVPLLLKRATVRGVLVGSRRHFEAANRALEALGIRPVIDTVYPLSEAVAAFTHLNRGPFGKVVISVAR